MGHTHIEKVHIENTFIDFFSNLWDEPMPNSFSHLLQALPLDLNTISSFDCDMLTKDVSKEEAFFALNSLENGKNPGPYGLMLNSLNFFGKTLAILCFLLLKNFSLVLPCRRLGVKLL